MRGTYRMSKDISFFMGSKDNSVIVPRLSGAFQIVGLDRTTNWNKSLLLKLFSTILHLYDCTTLLLSSTKPFSVVKTLPDVPMMHSDVLISQAREGDRHAQGRLVQLWYKRIYNFSYKFFYDHDLAMEVAQKTFISMHRNIAYLQDAARFRSWLYTIAVNCCREELRKRKSDRSVSLSDLRPGEAEDSYTWERSGDLGENPERMLRQTELADLLQTCLMQLSEEQREVVIMKEYEGLKFREIAETLNISENTVKSRMYYGLEALKIIFERRKITKETIGYEL